MPHPHIVRRRRATLATAALGLAAIAGCRQAARGFGESPTAARQHADDFLGAISARFTDVYRTPKFALARPRLAKHAMTPSRLEGDTSIWTATEKDGARVLTLAGYSNGSRYIFNPAKDWPLPTRAGQSRHVIRLTPLGDGAYAWKTDVDQAVGTMPAQALSDAFGGFFRALELVPEAAIKADSRLQFPRTTAALGRLFSVDSLHAVPHREGGRSVEVVIRLHPERLEKGLPAFAAYLRKYVEPARYAFTLRERVGGMRWLEAMADDNRLVLRFRVHDGRLQPFDGAPRAMPEQLRLDGEMFARVMIFEVGASELHGEVTRVRTAREDGWRLAFQQEPEWHLPLATKHLIRAPLRRPFEGSGTTVFLSLRQDAGATYLSRGFRTVVKESAILRWLGALGATAAGDFAGKSEEEENRFLAEAFTAMRLDSRELLRSAALVGQ